MGRGALLRLLGAALPQLRLQQAAGGAAGLVAARGVKTTTGIVGLPVDEQARASLGEVLQQVLDAIKVVPESAEYRRSVEKTVGFKLRAVGSEAPDEELEEMFSRQLEEEIKMAKEELELIPKMAEWKPWEVPEGHTVPMLEQTEVEQAVAGGAASPQAAPPPPPPPKP